MSKSKIIAALLTSAILCSVPMTGYAQGQAENADDIIQTPAVQQQDSVKPQSNIEKELAAAKSENADDAVLKQKVELARKMHQVRPTSEQVDAAIERASLMLPAPDRLKFINAMKSILNYNAIERISVDSMVETFTLVELTSMVEYYSKPEALSASNKMAYWAGDVQPEITRMIDKALMRLKTGQ